MKKVIIVFGTRPEAIKMAPVIREFQKYKYDIDLVICITAQHREMLDEVLRVFQITPNYDLDVMLKSQSPFEITSKVLIGIREVLLQEKPDIVLVQGDTTTTFSTALSAYYLKIPIGHIEAGLRTHDMYNPFPEELNRKMTSALSSYHFVPTESAKHNLLREGVDSKTIFLTGNTVIDALFWIIDNTGDIREKLVQSLPFLRSTTRRIILTTAHRRESFGAPLRNILTALRILVERNYNIEIVYPLHPNPNVQETAREVLSNIERIHLIESLSYASFVHLMKEAYLILTDSGGIQEEAPSLGKPVLVMRSKTERPEALEAGTAKLVGTDVNRIVEATEKLLEDKCEYKRMANIRNPFGDGKASARIAEIVRR